MEYQSAVLDTDFLRQIANYRASDEERHTLFSRLMIDLAEIPVVHPFVFEEELLGCAFARELVATGKMRKAEYAEFIPEFPEGKLLYRQMFCNMYQVITLEDYGESREPDGDIFAHHAGRSYGEIHSMLMALELKIPIFYSSDHSAITLSNRFAAGKIQAVTMKMLCEQLHNSSSPITRNQRRGLLAPSADNKNE